MGMVSWMSLWCISCPTTAPTFTCSCRRERTGAAQPRRDRLRCPRVMRSNRGTTTTAVPDSPRAGIRSTGRSALPPWTNTSSSRCPTRGEMPAAPLIGGRLHRPGGHACAGEQSSPPTRSYPPSRRSERCRPGQSPRGRSPSGPAAATDPKRDPDLRATHKALLAHLPVSPSRADPVPSHTPAASPSPAVLPAAGRDLVLVDTLRT
jgi:hypothetical protein